MEITCAVNGGVALLGLTGPFAVDPDESEILPLRSAIRALIGEGRCLVVVNVAGLTSIDARGLGELVFTLTTLRRCGGDLRLVAPTESLRRLLAVTRLDGVLPSCDSEIEAIRSIRQPAVRVAHDGTVNDGRRDFADPVLEAV